MEEQVTNRTVWERLSAVEKKEIQLDTVMNSVEAMVEEFVKNYNKSNPAEKISARITPFISQVHDRPGCVMTAGLNFELKRKGTWNNVFQTKIGFERVKALTPEEELDWKLYIWKKLGSELVALGISFVIIQQEYLTNEQGQDRTLQSQTL